MSRLLKLSAQKFAKVVVKGRDPAQQASLKLRGLDRSKDRIEPVVRRNAVPEINDLGSCETTSASPSQTS